MRISLEQDHGDLSLVVEGRLVGPWVDELRRVSAKHISGSSPLLIDLCNVTAMDARGQAVVERVAPSRRVVALLRCDESIPGRANGAPSRRCAASLPPMPEIFEPE